jgi:hypothetical protein
MGVTAGDEPDVGFEAIVLKFLVQAMQFGFHSKFVVLPAHQAHADGGITRAAFVWEGSFRSLVEVGGEG